MWEMPVKEILDLELIGNYWSFARRDPVNPELLSRIIEGALTSPLTPVRMLTALKQRLNLE